MKNCIRFLSVLMALLLACAAGSAELSAPGVLPLSDKTIHFTVGVAKSSVVEDWNTNAMTLKLQKIQRRGGHWPFHGQGRGIRRDQHQRPGV